MQTPLRLAILIPASVLLAAGGPCGGDTDNPAVERCASRHTIVVERGAKSAALPNLCATTVNTTEWDRARWDVTFDIPPPLMPSADWAEPERPVYAVEAPMAAAVGDVVGALIVTLKGSQCTSATGELADCVATIDLTIRVVPPGTVAPLSVRIAATRPSGAPTADDGRVALGERITLTAIAEGEHAREATFAWHGLDVVGGAVDTEVDGKSGAGVLTSPFEVRERVYEVTATTGALTARAVLVLAGLATFDEPVRGPLMAVPSYPGSPWVIRYDFGLFGSARLEYLPESASWAREEQDAFLRDEVRQARAVWGTLGANPEVRLDCPGLGDRLSATQQTECTAGPAEYPTYFAPNEAQGRLGIFRAIFWGVTGTGQPGAFSHTFVRRY